MEGDGIEWCRSPRTIAYTRYTGPGVGDVRRQPVVGLGVRRSRVPRRSTHHQCPDLELGRGVKQGKGGVSPVVVVVVVVVEVEYSP